MTARLRVAVCADFREEGWPSMDRVADKLLAQLSRDHADTIDAAAICPPFTRRASRLSAGRVATNIDRAWNRLLDYPRHVGTLRDQYDVFHIIDHSYAQLVHRLPATPTIVTCHDLDTFRSILQSEAEPRSWWFKSMTGHILLGLKQAACVTCDTSAVRDELVALDVVPAERIVVAPIGVGEQFSPNADPVADWEIARLIAGPPDAVRILHVGSTVPRKRIDTLLHAVAELGRQIPQIHLLRVGGPFTVEQEQLARELELEHHISVLPPLDDRLLAAAYRCAALVVIPSEREGFGLPIVEAMACGTAVVASDLASLREVGGAVTQFCTTGDPESYAREAIALLRARAENPSEWATRRARGIAWARQFTWRQFADRLADIYVRVARPTRSISSRTSEPCPV
jgi:glycosyltransferase involved in cell wall biosynthesis